MDKKVLFPLVIAVIAAVLVYMVLLQKESSYKKAYETVRVLVARTDIIPRTVLSRDMFRVEEIPRKYVQQDAYENPTTGSVKDIENFVTAVRIPKGNQLTTSSLMRLSPESGLSVKVLPARRGALLKVEQAWANLIKPGDYIDILVTISMKMSDGKQEETTATLLQDVRVLGVGANLGQGMSEEDFKRKNANQDAFADSGTLSLMVSPIDAQYLVLAEKQGTINIVVRPVGDHESHPMTMASFRKLIR